MDADLDLGIHTVDQAIHVIVANLKHMFKCFEFFLVLPFTQFERTSQRR